MTGRFRWDRRGFTLVELMIVIALVGVLAALAVYGAQRYLATAKTAEAKQNVGAIMRGLRVSLDEETAAAELLTGGGTSSAIPPGPCSKCSPFKSCMPVPIKAPNGKKFQPSVGSYDFCCWNCAHYRELEATYYSYNFHIGGEYEAVALGAPALGDDGIEVVAHGDLDGDLIESTFALGAVLDPSKRTMRVATQVFLFDEFE